MMVRGFLIVLLSLVSCTLYAQVNVPAPQASLHQFHGQFCPVYKQSGNEKERTELFQKFIYHQPRLAKNVGGHISGWQGHVENIITSGEGQINGVVIVSDLDGIKIRYSHFSDDETLHESVLNSLEQLTEGDPVLFSGSFFKTETFYSVVDTSKKAFICSPDYKIQLEAIKTDPKGFNKKEHSEDDASKKKPVGLSFNIGLGIGTHDAAGVLSLSYHITDSDILTLRRAKTNEWLSGVTSHDIGLLYGRGYTTPNFHASISVGIALMGGHKTYLLSDNINNKLEPQPSIPVEGQIFLLTDGKFGFGLYGFANINPKRHFAGLTVAVKLRF